MLTLIQSLEKCDSGYLRIIAELWGLALEMPLEAASQPEKSIQRISRAMLDRILVSEIFETLPIESRSALMELQSNQGFMPWSQFIRKYGDIREIGPGKRDREKPYLHPSSAVETLWYRAFIFRTFLDTPSGPQEFAYIPSDLADLLPEELSGADKPIGRPATAAERTYLIKTNDRILDHICTLLAAVRLNMELENPEVQAVAWDKFFDHTPTPSQLLSLLVSLGWLEARSQLPEPEITRQFLELPRGQALVYLFQSWKQSTSYNELSQLPGISMEGGWQNDPLRTRNWLLDLLAHIPQASWWSLPAFISGVKTTQPDFQRPAGDYDSWYLRDLTSGEYLRGFKNWDQVEGALIRFMIIGPLHWLGILDLAATAENAPPTAFRFSPWADNLLAGSPPGGLSTEEGKLLVSSNAHIRVPRLAPRSVRYQLARFCTWEKADQDAYDYWVTPVSLLRARQQGLKTGHLITLLNRYAKVVPPSLVRALQRWEESGSEARIETATILRLRSPEILQAVRSSRAARFLGEPLGPTVITIKPEAAQKVLAILAELGYLAEAEIN